MRLVVFIFLCLFAITGYTQQLSTIERRLAELNIVLPEVSDPAANYVKYVKSGNLIYLSGHGPCGGEFKKGKVGADLSVEEGYTAARQTGICLLATLKKAVNGDWSKIVRIVKLTGMVQCTDDFQHQPEVINGCSDLLTEVFGEKGKHARSAVGMVSLPRNIPVEIEMIVEIR